MYKIAGENNARRASRIKMADAIQPVQITLQEEYDTVRRMTHKVVSEVEKMPPGPERKEKIKRQVEL